jgi:hypothetical protein
MSVTLDLPKELESALSDEADRLNLSLSEYILRVLTAARPIENVPATGAELATYWQNEGVIGTRSDIADSPEYARQLRRKAEKRLRG